MHGADAALTLFHLADRADAMIVVKNLKKSFGEVKAVNDVSFVAQDGEITGLLGPNGAGKTTTLRMLYTLLPPDEGEIRIDGMDPTIDAMDIKRTLGVVPDGRGLYTRLTARENIAYYGELHGMRKSAIQERIATLVETLGMDDFIDRRTEGFSQGQRVKVAIARAMIHDPPVLIFDEATSGLDILVAREVLSTVEQLCDQGKCIVFSSHIMSEVRRLCNRVAIMHRGKILAEGSLEQLAFEHEEDDLEELFYRLIKDATPEEHPLIG